MPADERSKQQGRSLHETSVDCRVTRRRRRREHDETGGSAMGMGLGLGPRRIRRRCPDWRGVVAAGLLLLLSGLQLPRVRLWLRVSGLRLRLSGLFLRRLLRRLRRLLWRLQPLLWLPRRAAVVIHRACAR